MDDTKVQAPPSAEQHFLSQLRTATEHQHKALEATNLSMMLVSKDLHPAQYAAYLLHMRQVIAVCEGDVFPVVAHLFTDIEEREKLPAIDADIEVLSGKVDLPRLAPYIAAIPTGNVPFALGFMYVVEGSTLGGRMLLNHVKSVLGYNEHSGAGFFGGYGSDTGPKWKEFLRVLSAYAVEHHCAAAVIEGANYAFNSIKDHFAQTAK